MSKDQVSFNNNYYYPDIPLFFEYIKMSIYLLIILSVSGLFNTFDNIYNG